MEAFQSIKDEPLRDCPECHEPKLERLISATAFHLKGGGWYKDLYSTKPGASGGNADKSEKVASKIAETKSNTPNSDKAA
jgi:putative FmdB family regulatory protein